MWDIIKIYNNYIDKRGKINGSRYKGRFFAEGRVD